MCFNRELAVEAKRPRMSVGAVDLHPRYSWGILDSLGRPSFAQPFLLLVVTTDIALSDLPPSYFAVLDLHGVHSVQKCDCEAETACFAQPPKRSRVLRQELRLSETCGRFIYMIRSFRLAL